MREVASGAENHNRTWLRHRTRGQTFPERVRFGLISRSVHAHTQVTCFATDFKRNLRASSRTRDAVAVSLFLAVTGLLAVIWCACRQLVWKLPAMESSLASLLSWCSISKYPIEPISGHCARYCRFF